MKTLAKIILASSLITLAACSGKGSGESRIHNIPSDEGDEPNPAVINDEEGVNPSETPAGEEGGSTGNIVACQDESGAFCAETTDLSLKSECTADQGGKLVSKCPSGGKKCNIDIPNVTYYAYEGLVDCKTLEEMMNGDWE